ncbi:SMC family ATPase [Actinomyces sp. HMSC035G02]|uniref:AAA family ATPase n=1 Tax=Actinomyces sp. HMSC035G02 TaxID=1739406 RepID=UPI0008A8C946|nr:SMC family ATPase [Actinomyces sp. HMSC035G02]OHR20402.1 ATP-dependent dsDNA exonuclease [Actinomyces sp. HMSC035G02]
MKIRWLRIVGIGPFAGEHTVDFSAFEDSGLFLLDGPTGAGKSTLIDAITFALYGDVARTKDASKDRLRSNHISDSDPSEADLVFEVATGIYRVTRTPAYTPAGKKSQRNSKSTLTRVVEDPDAPDGWRTVEPIASGPRDVGYEIPAIVGLDKDQFLQTIVLPQGKFSQFLNATSDAREQILRDIFDTQIYVDFTKALVDAAASSKRGIEERRIAAVGAFERARSLDDALSEDVHTDAPGAEERAAEAEEAAQLDAGAEDPSAVTRWADDACERAREAHMQTLRVAEAATASAREASRALSEGRALAEAQAEHARVSAKLAELAASEEAIASDRELAGQARRALAVVPLDAAEASALARLEAAGDQVAALSPALSDADSIDPASLTPEAVAALRERAQNLRDEATRTRGSLEEALAVEHSLPEARAQIESLRFRREQETARIASIEAEREALPLRIEQTSEALRLMRADADTLPEAASALRAINERLDASMQADLLRSALLGASDELREATVAAKLANAAAADGHDLWIAQSASALARELEEDTPCPVCGSTEHPTPAPAVDGEITREQVAELDQARDRAESALRDAQARHQDLVRRIAHLNEVAGAPTPTLETERDRAAELVAKLEALSPQIAEIEAALAQERMRLDGLNDSLASAREAAASLASTLEERESALAAAVARVEVERADFVSLDERAAHLDERAHRAAALAGACTDWDNARAAHAQARHSLADALTEQGLQADSWRSLLLPLPQVEALEARVAEHEKALFAAREALASQRLTRAASTPAPNLESLTEATRKAEEEAAASARASGILEQHCAQLDAARASLKRALEALAHAREQAGPIRRLADIAAASGPENLASTPLSAWVLISRLEEVLAAANPRLAAISSGRYELVSVPDDGTASRKSGLGLAIIDHDTDALRSPRTLSGGETFYTSLALALGLADVVSAEAGGVELRTMFIDEGFGSLDSHTLSLVMAQLQALRCAGRTVGVISHVEEMATQIADQIQVRPLPEGGSTLSVRA